MRARAILLMAAESARTDMGMLNVPGRKISASTSRVTRRSRGNIRKVGPPGGVEANLKAFMVHSGMRVAASTFQRHLVNCLTGSRVSSRSSWLSRPDASDSMRSLAITNVDRSFMALYMLEEALGTPTRLNMENAVFPEALEYPSAIATQRLSCTARMIFMFGRSTTASQSGLTPVPLPRNKYSTPASRNCSAKSSPPVPRKVRVKDFVSSLPFSCSKAGDSEASTELAAIKLKPDWTMHLTNPRRLRPL